MSYEPDHYHQTNPPTELKRDVMGRKGSKKNKVSDGKRSDSATCSACCGAPRTTNGSEEGTKWYECSKCGSEFFEARDSVGYKLGCDDTEKKVAEALEGHPDSELFGDGGLIAATISTGKNQSRLLEECARYIKAMEDSAAESMGIGGSIVRSKTSLEERLWVYMPNVKLNRPL